MTTRPPILPDAGGTTAPRLVRAVAEATQPYGPFLQGQALHTLEEYMADASFTQAVYQALLNRASAEPISLAVVAKCVDVMKRYIPRFAASNHVLQQIDRFCQTTATNLGNTYSGLQKSVLYLHTLAVNIMDSRMGVATSHRNLHARGISEPALLVKRGSSSSLGRDEFYRTNSVPEGAEPAISLLAGSLQSQTSVRGASSVTESSAAVLESRAAVPEEPEYEEEDYSCSSRCQAGWLSHQCRTTEHGMACTHALNAATAWPDLPGRREEAALRETVQVQEEEAASSSDRIKSDVLHWRWAPSTPEELTAAVEAGIVSDHHADLGHFRLSVPPDPGDSLKLSAAHALAVQQEMRIVRQAQRQQVQQASHPGPESLRPKLRDNRPRLLFQHLPYSQQEKLQLSDREVAVVVEGVLGVVDGQSFWGGKDLLGSRDGSGRGSKQGEHAGRVCASILVKLLLDLWSMNGAELSFPLALMLLNGGLENGSPTVRARVFDVIYNLEVHAELLYPTPADAFVLQMQLIKIQDLKIEVSAFPGRDALILVCELPELGRLIGPLTSQLLSASGPVHTAPATTLQASEGREARDEAVDDKKRPPEPVNGSAEAEAEAHTNKQRFKQWLLLLLFQLLLMTTQRQSVLQAGESSEAVWLAALGALLHTTVEDGKPDRAALQALPPQVLSALLRRCQEFHWSEQTHCHLVRMTVNLLYAPVAGPSAEGEAVEPALVLKEERLEDFGGIEEVIRHFKKARSREAARNLLSVLLDYVSAKHIKAGVESGEDTVESGLLENLRLIGFALEASGMAELLQGAFQCAWPGFSAEFARTLTAGEDGKQSGKRAAYAAVVQSILGRLESLACDCAVSVPPESLLPAVQHTLDCVQGDGDEPAADPVVSDPELGDVWTSLAARFCSEDEWEAALGASWLLSLLLTAAERHLSTGVHHSGSFKRGGVALFPGLPEHLPSPKGPRGIQDQPHLAALLRHILARAPVERSAASRLVDTLARLLQYIKLKCGNYSSATAAAHSPQPTDGGKPLAIPSPAGSVEMGLNSPPTVPSILLSDEDATPRPDGAGDGGELEWGEVAELWTHTNPVDLMLPTLFLAVEWLLDAPQERRGDACLEVAELLLNMVCARSCSFAAFFQQQQAQPGKAADQAADWMLEEYSQAATPCEAAVDGLTSATHTCPVVTAFLLGAVAVPRDVLLKVSPVLLARLFQHLGTGRLPPHSVAEGTQAALWARDVRAALLLLLIARCSLETVALQQAGGEGVFVDLLADSDPRVRFHAATFLQQRLRTARPEVYRRALRHLMQQAQQHDDNKLLRSAHLQLSAMLELRLVDFSV